MTTIQRLYADRLTPRPIREHTYAFKTELGYFKCVEADGLVVFTDWLPDAYKATSSVELSGIAVWSERLFAWIRCEAEEQL